MHFAGVPVGKKRREEFVRQACDSLPRFTKSLRILEVGCGKGALTANFVPRLQQVGKAAGMGEILLINPSPAVVDVLVKTVGEVFLPSVIRGVNRSIQDCCDTLAEPYDVALRAAKGVGEAAEGCEVGARVAGVRQTSG